ncbi:hypothetical protein BJV78DRAFT_1226498 [Lactifluus subvellereus]|nr:hypothetical protein BJV78DRAFT_1226498 [Lactifluus subvellereus]
MHTSRFVTLLLAGLAYGVALTSAGVRNHLSDPYNPRSNPLHRLPPWAAVLQRRQDASGTPQQDLDMRPTPEPTGEPSVRATLVSDAEMDAAEAFCALGSSNYLCENRMPDGFITAASFESADDNSWIQVRLTGCLDASKFQLDPSDTDGQLDVRFPNGAQCTFGGQGASFVQLVEPTLNRFCLRCYRTANDQVNYNSHRDRPGCENAIPGKYDFPERHINCV